MKKLITELPWHPLDDTAQLKLAKDQSFRCVYDPDNLICRTREDIALTYWDWTLTVAKARAQWYTMLGVDFIIFVAAFLINPWLLVFLIPAIPFTLRAQFNYGDCLDDSHTWASKKVTRIDG